MAGRNTRLQTVSNLCKAAGRRLFFIQNIFIQNVTFRYFHSPITASAKQAARTRAAKQTPAKRGRKRKQAPATSCAGRKAAQQSVERIRLTESGLVTANVQAHGSWVRARTDYAGRSASCVKMVDCMNLFRISHASVRA